MPTALIAEPIALAVLKVASVALLGWLLARRQILHDDALADLSNLIIRVLVPFLVFTNAAAGFAGLSLSSSLILLLASPIQLGIGYLAGVGLARLLRVPASHRRAVVGAATFQNSAYLPIAVSTAVLPMLAAAFPVGTATQAGTIAGNGVLCISLYGVLYSPLFWGLGLSWLQGEPGKVDLRDRAFWKRLFPPPVIGVLLGYLVGLTPLHLLLTPPHAPLNFLFLAMSDVGGLTVPIANLILGGMLAQAMASRALLTADVLATAIAKLVIVPAVGFGLLWLTRASWHHNAALSLAAFVIFVECVSPPATNLAVMAKNALSNGTDETRHVIPGLLLVAYPLTILAMPLWLLAFFALLHKP